MKYMVMECHLSYAVVLDEDGRFLKAANLHYEVGQTVTDIVEMRQPGPQKKSKKVTGWVYSLAAMAACLILVVASVFQTGQMTYGSVYLTINPAVRIDVNRSDVVVNLEGTNEDGRTLIKDYLYKRKDLELVMDELADRAIDMGYLHEGGQITLTLDADDDEWIASRRSTLPARLDKHLTEKLSVTITVTDTNSENHEVIIPVSPDENGYGNSNYSNPPKSGAGSSRKEPYVPDNNPHPAAPTIPSYGESDYGVTDDDVTDNDRTDDDDDSGEDKEENDDEPDDDREDDDD